MAYRILSFCGGGIRGLLSAGYLDRLYSENQAVVSHADLLAGTSTGANIVSQILASKTPPEIYDSYQTDAPKVFANPNDDPTMPAYDIEVFVGLQLALHQGQNVPISEIDRRVLFTAFDVGSVGRAWEPRLLHNFPESSTGATPLVDAVVASSAMPGMYGSYKGQIDGAFVNHDPTLAAIALAVANGHDINDIVAICFGTGLMPNWIASDTAQWGAYEWQNGDGNPANRTQPLLINGTISPILNASLSGTSTALMPQLCQLLLGERYAYIDSTLDRIIPENDTNPADLDYMMGEVARADLTQATTLLNKYWS